MSMRQQVPASLSHPPGAQHDHAANRPGRLARFFDGHPGLQAYLEKVRRDNLRFLVSAVAWNLLMAVAPIAIGMIAVANLLFRSSSQQHVIVRQVSRALQGVLGPSYLERLVNLTIQHNILTGAIAIEDAEQHDQAIGPGPDGSVPEHDTLRRRTGTGK